MMNVCFSLILSDNFLLLFVFIFYFLHIFLDILNAMHESFHLPTLHSSSAIFSLSNSFQRLRLDSSTLSLL